MITIDFLSENLPSLISGAGISLSIAGIGCFLGMFLGLACVVCMGTNCRYLKWIVQLYVNLIRGTPMLIQILFLYFVLPGINIHIPAFWTAVLAIGLNSGAYVSNIIRAGMLSVGKGQMEAALVLGLTKMQALRLIILPQAFRVSIPTLGNEFITLVKDSSLASVIGVFELSKQGELLMHKTYDAMSSYTLVAILYLCMTLSLSAFMFYIEKKVNAHVHR